MPVAACSTCTWPLQGRREWALRAAPAKTHVAYARNNSRPRQLARQTSCCKMDHPFPRQNSKEAGRELGRCWAEADLKVATTTSSWPSPSTSPNTAFCAGCTGWWLHRGMVEGPSTLPPATPVQPSRRSQLLFPAAPRCAAPACASLPRRTSPRLCTPAREQAVAPTWCTWLCRWRSHTSLPSASKAARLPRESEATISSLPSLFRSATATCACTAERNTGGWGGEGRFGRSARDGKVVGRRAARLRGHALQQGVADARRAHPVCPAPPCLDVPHLQGEALAGASVAVEHVEEALAGGRAGAGGGDGGRSRVGGAAATAAAAAAAAPVQTQQRQAAAPTIDVPRMISSLPSPSRSARVGAAVEGDAGRERGDRCMNRRTAGMCTAGRAAAGRTALQDQASPLKRTGSLCRTPHT